MRRRACLRSLESGMAAKWVDSPRSPLVNCTVRRKDAASDRHRLPALIAAGWRRIAAQARTVLPEGCDGVSVVVIATSASGRLTIQGAENIGERTPVSAVPSRTKPVTASRMPSDGRLRTTTVADGRTWAGE
jgi:hypothetical protein